MNPVLANSTLDEQLATHGFVTVPFLRIDKVQELINFFHENHQERVPGFYATAHSTDISFRKKMSAKIKMILEPVIAQYFQNCIPLGGSYVVKSNLQHERLNPHQDWNIVDEAQYRSYNIWIPLVDLTQENGAIRVAPGSHLWLDNYRGPQISDCLAIHNETIWQNMQTLNMKAGEALIYDHRLFHASYPNLTEELRIAIVFGIVPIGAQMLHYYGNGSEIDVYESSINFFMEGEIQKGPDTLRKIKTISPPTYRINSLPLYLENLNPKSSFWTRLKKIFTRY